MIERSRTAGGLGTPIPHFETIRAVFTESRNKGDILVRSLSHKQRTFRPLCAVIHDQLAVQVEVGMLHGAQGDEPISIALGRKDGRVLKRRRSVLNGIKISFAPTTIQVEQNHVP